MADVFTPEKRSKVMSLIRSKNTKPEIAFRKLISTRLYPLGYRYRIHAKHLPGNPDVVFVSKKVALFIDGSFWHGYKFANGQKLKRKYWLPKIKRNIERDKEVNKLLKSMGWSVLRIWEHDLKKNPDRVLKRVGRILSIKF